MLKHIKTLLKDNIFFISIIVTISIAYLSLIKVPDYSLKLSHSDKIQHIIAYFTLTICWLFSFFKRKSNIKCVIVFACIFYGIILEALQVKLTSYRTGDYLDVLANTFGVLLALMIFNRFFKKNQFN